ncbi:MAG: mechanosensitive ion channel family protein [Sphingobacteriia bacterium]|nr:mechanosensitive ion channel family protein [Sphingobacteriia bacterium]
MKRYITVINILLYLCIAPASYLFAEVNKPEIIHYAPYLSSTKDSSLTSETQTDFAQKMMRASDSIRTIDSLRVLVLKEELLLVKASDKQRKKEIEVKLRNLERKDSLRIQAVNRKIDSLRKITKGSPVLLSDDTLFMIYTSYGPLAASERAKRVSESLDRIKTDYYLDSASFTLQKNEETYEILYNGNRIASVTTNDALWAGISIQDLASDRLNTISKALITYKESTSFTRISIKVLLALGFLVVLFIFIRLIHKGFKKLTLWFTTNHTAWIKGIHIGTYELLSVNKTLILLVRSVTILKWILILLLIYLSLPILFGLFPWTESLAEKLLNFILHPFSRFFAAIIAFIPNLISIGVIILITFYIIKGLKFLTGEVEKGALVIPGFYADWAIPTYNIVKVLIYAFSLIVIFPYLPGSNSPIFQGVSIFVGILFSLGSSTAISNAVAGIVMTYMRPFKIGDKIKVNDIVGVVVEKGLLVTRIKSVYNEEYTVPNSMLLGNYSVNYSRYSEEKGLILTTSVTIGYDAPWRDVHKILIQAADRTSDILRENKPYVHQSGLEDFYVAYTLHFFIDKPTLAPAILSELHGHIQDCFNEAGIEIMSPHYRAERDGNQVTIPAAYLNTDQNKE